MNITAESAFCYRLVVLTVVCMTDMRVPYDDLDSPAQLCSDCAAADSALRLPAPRVRAADRPAPTVRMQAREPGDTAMLAACEHVADDLALT